MHHAPLLDDQPPKPLRCVRWRTNFASRQAYADVMDDFIQHFVRLERGTWTCVRPAEFQGPNGRIQVTRGSTFITGSVFMGVDLARWLDEQYDKACRQK